MFDNLAIATGRSVVELAQLWGLSVTGMAVWPDRARQEQLAALARQVRRAGAVPVPEPSAGERDWLAETAGLRRSAGHLTAAHLRTGRDSKSAFGIAVRGNRIHTCRPAHTVRR